jgi:hypothetical protein
MPEGELPGCGSDGCSNGMQRPLPDKKALTLLQLTIFFGLDPLGLVPIVPNFGCRVTV